MALTTGAMLGLVVLAASVPAFAADLAAPSAVPVAQATTPARDGDAVPPLALRQALKSLERLRMLPTRDVAERLPRPRLRVAAD